MRTKQEIEKLAEQEYREFPSEQKDVVGNFNRDINCHRKRKAFVKGYIKAVEDFSNSWTKGCECKESIGQTWCCNICGLPYASNSKTDKIFNRNELFEVANKIWNDISNNDTLTYNSFGEYFKNEFKKYL